MKSYIIRLEWQLDSQHEEILDMKSRSMRDNIILHGLKEEDSENLRSTFEKIMGKDLQTERPKDIGIDRIHRVGAPKIKIKINK